MEGGHIIELIPSQKIFILRIDGYLYYRHGKPNENGVTKWVCRNKKCCYAWAKRTQVDSTITLILGGPHVSIHKHPSNVEKVQALKFTADLKRKAVDQPESAPVLILRNTMQNVSRGVLAEIPYGYNLGRSMKRQRLKDLPPNPVSMKDLTTIPEKFRYTEFKRKDSIWRWLCIGCPL